MISSSRTRSSEVGCARANRKQKRIEIQKRSPANSPGTKAGHHESRTKIDRVLAFKKDQASGRHSSSVRTPIPSGPFSVGVSTWFPKVPRGSELLFFFVESSELVFVCFFWESKQHVWFGLAWPVRSSFEVSHQTPGWSLANSDGGRGNGS